MRQVVGVKMHAEAVAAPERQRIDRPVQAGAVTVDPAADAAAGTLVRASDQMPPSPIVSAFVCRETRLNCYRLAGLIGARSREANEETTDLD